MPSTLTKLKDAARNLTPKFAVSETAISSGGLTMATSAGALPRGRQQAADLRRRCDEGLLKSAKSRDPLFSVMLMCKESEGQVGPGSFVRAVNGAPEPMAVLAFDWSLNDLERFCIGENSTIISFDPAFSLGDFDVTVTTYRHPQLVNKFGNHPVMMGPLFIHECKKFETYHFFASTLVGLKPSLVNIGVFGTDGEKALSDALHSVFTKAIHFRCFLHLRGNWR